MSRQSQRLRIIGGEHRGRILNFNAAPSLRPTPDRVRETLFNWLQPVIEGANCLDLFAGSGALGLEAASRGAAQVVWIESHAASAEQIKQHIKILKLDNASVETCKAAQYLKQPSGKVMFDVVFLDPPFNQDLLLPSCELLESNGWLKPGARIYLEAETAVDVASLPASWQLTHQKQAGQVHYHLAVRE